ncbi:hypothetical protein VJI76_09275, partial [Parvimonas sp. M13]|nr:hypothetical protein [Parvimonas sp. M13]
ISAHKGAAAPADRDGARCPAAARRSAIAGLPAAQRVFLLLQGPHGPFFDRLGRLLRDTGAEVLRVGFNAGDEFFWRDSARY